MLSSEALISAHFSLTTIIVLVRIVGLRSFIEDDGF
tara:strand:+ start:207 stop:314 length:108 start_codon:yes stop_codon:yes gene_type:complete